VASAGVTEFRDAQTIIKPSSLGLDPGSSIAPMVAGGYCHNVRQGASRIYQKKTGHIFIQNVPEKFVSFPVDDGHTTRYYTHK
jgi:hypothetical protein